MKQQNHINGRTNEMGLMGLEWHGPALRALRIQRGLEDVTDALKRLNQFAPPGKLVTKQLLSNWETSNPPSGVYWPSVIIGFGILSIEEFLGLYRNVEKGLN